MIFLFMAGCGTQDEDPIRPIGEVPGGGEGGEGGGESPFVCFSGLSPEVPVCFFSIIENSFLSPGESYYYLEPKREMIFLPF